MISPASVLLFMAWAQSPPDFQPRTPYEPPWRSALAGLLSRPAATANVQDVRRLEENVRSAIPYLSAVTPRDYEENRELVRRMTTYLAQLSMLRRNPQMRMALRRANQAVADFDYLLPASPMPERQAESTPPSTTAAAPFDARAPEIQDAPAADRRTARDLQSRYEAAAAQAATAWRSAEVLRRSLAQDGMSLNVRTSTSIARVQLYLQNAAGALRERDWAEARVNLERAEYETENIFQTVGR